MGLHVGHRQKGMAVDEPVDGHRRGQVVDRIEGGLTGAGQVEGVGQQFRHSAGR